MFINHIPIVLSNCKCVSSACSLRFCLFYHGHVYTYVLVFICLPLCKQHMDTYFCNKTYTFKCVLCLCDKVLLIWPKLRNLGMTLVNSNITFNYY